MIHMGVMKKILAMLDGSVWEIYNGIGTLYEDFNKEYPDYMTIEEFRQYILERL